MKARLLLSGILLLSILTACSDRNDEAVAPADQKKEVKAARSATAKVVNDSISKSDVLNEANNKQEETIDPTKSDRPK